MFSNDIGAENTAAGFQALFNNTIGIDNTAIGVNSLTANISGQFNTAAGVGALQHNTTGEGNTAMGATALNNNTTGSDNIALGTDAGHSLTTGSDNIDVGNLGVVAESGTIRIGTAGSQTRTFITAISGTAVTGAGVIVNAQGQLGVAASSARFKKDIQSMNQASNALLALRPVTFQYKEEIDPQGIPQFGLIAEEVAKVNPALVLPDKEGKPYTVRYDQVNAMLLNEFLKEHRTVQELEAKITRQQKDSEMRDAKQLEQIEALTARLDEQAAQLQKVSAQLQTNNSSQRVAVNRQ